MSVKTLHKSKMSFLFFFTIYFLLIWLLWETPIIYPIKIFVVFLHEISHGLMASATGGRIDQIILIPNQGGSCYCPGGNAFLTLSAGYLGSMAWGVLLVAASRYRRIDPRHLTILLSTIVIVLTAAYLKNLFSIVFGILFGLSLLFVAMEFSRYQNQKLQLILGLTSCLYAILDIKSDILDRPTLRSDATMLHDLTGIPPVFWGFLWVTIAIFTCIHLIRWLYKDS